eukprot:Gb_00395 [translate_table: standard]
MGKSRLVTSPSEAVSNTYGVTGVDTAEMAVFKPLVLHLLDLLHQNEFSRIGNFPFITVLRGCDAKSRPSRDLEKESGGTDPPVMTIAIAPFSGSYQFYRLLPYIDIILASDSYSH